MTTISRFSQHPFYFTRIAASIGQEAIDFLLASKLGVVEISQRFSPTFSITYCNLFESVHNLPIVSFPVLGYQLSHGVYTSVLYWHLRRNERRYCSLKSATPHNVARCHNQQETHSPFPPPKPTSLTLTSLRLNYPHKHQNHIQHSQHQRHGHQHPRPSPIRP
jgi:hypothetical protein